MPKKDFTQVAFAVVQQATGEAPKTAQAPARKAAPQLPPKNTTKKAAKKD